MQEIKQLSSSICASLCASLITLGSSYSMADDTDVFFANAASGGETTPNVLIVLDTSQSMDRVDGTSEMRIDRMKAAVQELLTSDIDMNIGFMQFNGKNSGGPVLYPISDLTSNRAQMSAIVDDLLPKGGTPTLDTVYEAALYLRGEGVDYGKQRGSDDVSNNNRRFFRVSHEDSYTGGAVIRSTGCTDANLGSSACNSETITGNPVYSSPIAGTCQANHILVLSDGIISSNSSASKVRAMTGDTTCVASGVEECSAELVSWLNTKDQSDSFEGDQTITTSTIAFNIDADDKAYLEDLAINGGGVSDEASTADELLDVFNAFVGDVANVNASFSAPAASVNQFNRLSNNDDIYFSLFKPEVSSMWDGNVKRYRVGLDNSGAGDVAIRGLDGALAIDEDTGLIKDDARSWWPEPGDNGSALTSADGNTVKRGGAANQLQLAGITGIGERRVYTWVADASTDITTPIDLTANAQRLSETNDARLTDDVLGITGIENNAADQQAYRESLLMWARGVDVLDSDADGSTTDIRRHMGDPMHSTPKVVNYQSAPGDDVQSIIYVGTNEGYLHAFDTSNGEEQFAFVPYELLSNLNTFYNDDIGLSRPYGLDGPITLWRDDQDDDLIIESGDSAYLFVGMRRGGSSYYALDVTDPDTPKLAWTIKGGAGGTTGFENMGQSWSRLSPITMYINGASENVLVFGGGYDINQDPLGDSEAPVQSADSAGNSIYIVRAETGELLWTGSGIAGGDKRFDDMDYGFNAPIRAIDINRDNYVDQLYAADAGGQLWRFDVTQLHDGPDAFIDGGIIASFSANADSAHRRFYNEPDVALIESGSERYLTISIGSGWRADPLDRVVNDRFYMVRQYSVYDKPAYYGKSSGSASSSAIKESDLVNVTYTATPTTNEYGWFLELEGDGEKVLGTSVTFDNHVIFSAYQPAEQLDACSPDIGSGVAYVLDVTSGAPAFDLDNSDSGSTLSLTTADRSIDLNRSGIPAEATILITEDSLNVPVVLFGTEQLGISINNDTVRTFWADQGESGDF